MKKKRLWSDIVIYSLLTIAALYTLFPLLMALMNSFKSNRELLTNVMSWPTEWNLDNYIRTYEKMHYGRSFVDTACLAGLSVSLIILFSALAGWKLCRTKTGLSRFLLKLFIFSMLIPFSSIMIPLYKVTLALGIKNSLLGLSFVYAWASAWRFSCITDLSKASRQRWRRPRPSTDAVLCRPSSGSYCPC